MTWLFYSLAEKIWFVILYNLFDTRGQIYCLFIRDPEFRYLIYLFISLFFFKYIYIRVPCTMIFKTNYIKPLMDTVFAQRLFCRINTKFSLFFDYNRMLVLASKNAHVKSYMGSKLKVKAWKILGIAFFRNFWKKKFKFE